MSTNKDHVFGEEASWRGEFFAISKKLLKYYNKNKFDKISIVENKVGIILSLSINDEIKSKVIMRTMEGMEELIFQNIDGKKFIEYPKNFKEAVIFLKLWKVVLENDQLKSENDQLKSENDQLKSENNQLKREN